MDFFCCLIFSAKPHRLVIDRGLNRVFDGIVYCIPIVLDVEVLGGDGSVYGVIETFGGCYLGVRWPGRCFGVDYRFVYVTTGMRPIGWTCGGAATAYERTTIVLAV